MTETRETATAGMQQTIPAFDGGIAPPAGRKIPCLFIKHLHVVQHVCEQEKKCTMLPQANRAFIG